LSRREKLTFAAIAALAIVLRFVALFRYRFDSDEQQHLHVTWGWTAGLVQYRDIFDNHAPLFHMLTAPMLALVGERSTVLLWMRVPMLVLFGIVLWATYKIARELYDERVAACATVLLALFPPFFLKSLEFRNDNLWTALWMLALIALLQRRMLVVGVLLGAALAVSLKTSLLVIALAGAAAIAWFVRKERLPGVIRAAAGFILIPTALVIFFAAVGAWDELLFCNFTFNGNFARTRPHLWIGRAAFPFMLGGVLWLAWRFRSTEHRWRYFFTVVIGIFTITLAGFWPLISPRDFLPMMPLAAIFVAASLVRFANPIRAFAIAAAVCVASLYYYADRFENNTDWHITMMNQALRLSHPGEPLLDHKGETIYRKRPFYFAFEVATRNLMSRGIIRDTVAEDVIRTRTHVAQADGAMWPPRGRAFLNENFINLGRLRASGQWLQKDGTFTIAVPGEYVILSEHGQTPGILDGTLCTGPRELGAGAHRFVGREKNVAVLWAPAFQRGHSPFHLRDLDF
jgi:hypothetical protein